MNAVITWFSKGVEPDTAILLQGLRRADPSVIDGLIELFQHRLLRYLLSLTGNRATAEDLFQETWLRVLERGNQYNPQWKFEVWLFSIARNLAIDQARRKKENSLDQLLTPGAGVPFEPAGNTPSPYEDTWHSERGRRMAEAVSRIPAAYREVITLRFQEDLSLDDIARILKANLSTVKSRLYRGLETLRSVIGEQEWT
jgi:RNA polymerase sigma-70 factor (ECF subfamily)